MKNFGLFDRVALVTGASSGIGEVLARALAEEGAFVYLAGRRLERIERLAQSIRDSGHEACAIQLDVADESSVASAFAQIADHGRVVDVLVNNAGVSKSGSFLSLSNSDRDQVMNTNFTGVWAVAQQTAKALIAAQKPGSIINIASILGLSAKSKHAAYAASKAAVLQLSDVMSLDLMSHGIRVNAIAPGWFNTEMVGDYFSSEGGQRYIQRMPARRIGELEELIGPVLFLASELSSFVNGVCLPVDGALRHQV